MAAHNLKEWGNFGVALKRPLTELSHSKEKWSLETLKSIKAKAITVFPLSSCAQYLSNISYESKFSALNNTNLLLASIKVSNHHVCVSFQWRGVGMQFKRSQTSNRLPRKVSVALNFISCNLP